MDPLDDEKELPGDDDAPEAGSESTEGDDDALDGDEGDGEDDVSAGDEPEDDGGEAPDEVAETPRKRTASDTIRDQKRARKEAEARVAETERKAEERIAAAERRAEAAERTANERRRAETEAEEAARLELMSESEKIAHYRQKDREEHGREMAGVKFQIWDSTDRMSFERVADKDPLVARVKDKVEVEYQNLVRQGRSVSREIIANQEIAKMVRDGRLKAATTQRQRAAATVRRETVKPPRTQGDVAPNRARRGETDTKAAREKRLLDVQL